MTPGPKVPRNSAGILYRQRVFVLSGEAAGLVRNGSPVFPK